MFVLENRYIPSYSSIPFIDDNTEDLVSGKEKWNIPSFHLTGIPLLN